MKAKQSLGTLTAFASLACSPFSHAQLVGQWLLDEGSGSVYADSSPNGNDAFLEEFNGWLTETPPTGFANTASLEFDGATSYVATGFTGIGGDAARTVACWVKTTATNDHGIVAWGDSTSNGSKWHLRLNSNVNNGTVGAFRVETQGDYTIGNTIVNDGQWHHLAAVYSGFGELGTTILFVDGVAEAPGSNNPSEQAVNTSLLADPVTVGRRNQGANTLWFNGGVDDVRIYDRALSAQEVNALRGASPTTEGLVMHFPFEEGSGLMTDDLGSGNNDGILFPQPGSGPIWSTEAPPPLSNSLLFDGSTILFTDFPGVQGSASRSIALWFKTTNATDNGFLGWGLSTRDGQKWHVRLNSAAADGPVGALRAEIQGGRVVATTPVNDGEWHHAAFVFEEDADPEITDLVFYLDGEIEPISRSLLVPINTDSSASPSLNVTLGGRFQGNILRAHVGNLADIRIYESGLSQSEVQAIMAGSGSTPGEFKITSIERNEAESTVTIAWTSRPGESYFVFSSTDLSSAWREEVDDFPATPGGSTTSFTIPNVTSDSGRIFFRVSR